MQPQNKYLTFKQLNSRSTESNLPYSEERIGNSNNLLAVNVPEPIQEPVTATVNPVQEPVFPVTVQAVVTQEPVQAATVQTPVTVKATPAKGLPLSSILTPPPTVEAPSLTRKRKRPRIWFVNYLEDDDRPSRRPRRLRKSHPYKYSQDEED